MFHALLICSDDDCDYEVEVLGDLDELEHLACDCGCTLQVLQVGYGEEARIPERVWELAQAA